MLTAGRVWQLLVLAALLALGATQALHAEPETQPVLLPTTDVLPQFGSLQPLPPADNGLARLVLGDANGIVHVYEQRGDAFDEVWSSRHMEGGISGVVVADANDDGLDEIVVFTNRGRIYYLDTEGYGTLWSNSPGDYDQITAQAVANLDDDPQPELIFCASGRLVIFDGRDQFEEWSSDQSDLTTTQILIADIDGDGEDEIVLNDGYIFDARFRTLEWQNPDRFGDRMGALDLDDDGILELICEYRGRFIRLYDIDLRREKSLPASY